MWIDENSAPIIDMGNKIDRKESAAIDTYNGFKWGVSEKGWSYNISYDWITFTNAGAFAPGEEDAVIGRSLAAGTCDPCYGRVIWADADDDGDVDQDDYAVFQTCYDPSSVPGDPEYCSCFDQDGDSNVDNDDFLEFQACATGPGILIDPQNLPIGCTP
jgi:hypothetical protein